jgi:hypothetical protein
MKWLPVLCLSGILLLTALVYLPGVSFYFVADDFIYMERAGQLQRLTDLLPQIQGACTHVGWPVVTFIFWLGRHLSGLQPQSYRLIALAIHLTNAVLVFFLVRRIAGSKGMAAGLAAALVLALHPRQHEAVMWLAALTWAAGTLFALLSAYCYIAWRQTGRLPWLLGVFATVALAMISNPSTIVLPFIFAGYDMLLAPKPSGSGQTPRVWWATSLAVWLGLLAVVGALGLTCGLGSLPSSGDRASYGLGLSGIGHLGLFLVYTLWPVPLNLKEMLAATPPAAYAGVGIIVILLAGAGLAILYKGSTLARWGLAWAILALLPPAFFSAFTSDHYLSLMLAGVALAVAGVVQRLPARSLRVAGAIAALWLVFVVPQIVVKVDNWRTAGRITATVRDETLARYPSVADNTRFFYKGLPDTMNRAVVWSYGIDSAVRIWYNNTTLRARKDMEFGVTNSPRQREVILDFSGRW